MKLRGFVSESEKIKEYQTSLVFTLPSLWESYAQTVVEAMSCGTPALVSNNSGMREIVQNRKTGLKFETFDFKEYVDKMEYMLTNESEAKRMGIEGRKYVLKNFSFQVIEKRLYRIYKRVL